ncbi:MAG: alpha/beta hydrolase [Pseudomonadota bacterium]
MDAETVATAPFDRVTDWSDAYENRTHTPDFDRFPPMWRKRSAGLRTQLGTRCERVGYGPDPRQHLVLMRPAAAPRGLLVFYHGGYWRSLEPSDFLYLAEGALAAGHAVAMPAYRLAPDVTLPQITADALAALRTAAGLVAGPIALAGHSAGGHLACRLATTAAPLGGEIAHRLGPVLSISGLHDLRPLIATDKNADLRLDEETALAESPGLQRPRPGIRLTAWVGADERPEFVRQSALIANAWLGLGAATRLVVEPARHHFDVIEALSVAGSALTRTALGAEMAP